MASTRTKGRVVDLPQFYTAAATETGANTGVMAQVPSSLNTRDKVGILIHGYEMYFGATDIFAADADGVQFGLTQLYNQGTVPDFGSPGLVDMQTYFIKAYSSVGVRVNVLPYKVTFDNPRLCHPAALYWFFTGLGQPAALGCAIRMEYSYVDLSDAQYQDIIQTIILQNAL
jgi:hypothetical protein